jgi:hypothetical protein
VELVDVVGCAEPGGLPGLLAHELGEAMFELLHAGGAAGAAGLGGVEVGLQMADTRRASLPGRPPRTPKPDHPLCHAHSAATDPRLDGMRSLATPRPGSALGRSCWRSVGPRQQGQV